MSINSYAYDAQNADASTYIRTPHLWLLVAASGWLLTFGPDSSNDYCDREQTLNNITGRFSEPEN